MSEIIKNEEKAKRQRIFISLETNVKILDALRNQKICDFAKFFGLNESTIRTKQKRNQNSRVRYCWYINCGK